LAFLALHLIVVGKYPVNILPFDRHLCDIALLDFLLELRVRQVNALAIGVGTEQDNK
jgi:hypothetical protein